MSTGGCVLVGRGYECVLVGRGYDKCVKVGVS